MCQARGLPLKGIEDLAEPAFREYMVAFDGGGEWFVVQAVYDQGSPERPLRGKAGWHFGSCKTEHLPYNLCVQACLIAFSHHFGQKSRVSSDGSSADWVQARELCQRILGYGGSFCLETRDATV